MTDEATSSKPLNDAHENDGFGPDRNAEQIRDLRELSGEVLDPIPRLLKSAVMLSLPYLIVEYGSLVDSTLTVPQHFESTVTLATTIAVGFVSVLILFCIGLYIACRGIAWWVERRDVEHVEGGYQPDEWNEYQPANALGPHEGREESE